MNGLAIAVGERTLPVELSVAEAAELLGRSERTVNRQCAAGTLPTMPGRVAGGGWRIPTARLLDLLGIEGHVIHVEKAS